MITALVPTPSQIGREALIVLAGAVLAAFIVGQMPELKRWIKQQWTS